MDIFSTYAMRGVVASLVEPRAFLLSTFFTQIQADGEEEIAFDLENRKRRITPFVSPIRAGRVVERQGFTAKTFQPPYAKDKRRFDPSRPLRRAMGERIGGGGMSPQERRAMALRLEMEDQLRMLTLREEVMVSEILRTGKVTVAGDGFPTQQVDFGRAAGLTVAALTGGNRWSEVSTAKPLDDIETWAGLIQENSGAVPTTLVLDPKAWGWARQNEAVKDALDTRRGSASQMETGPLDGRQARFVGVLGDFEVWVYQDHYVDDDGAAQKVLPDGTAILSGGDLEGVRAYGAIKDEAAGYEADRYFVKSWLEQDPAVRWLLLQSAPLPIPYRANASLAATVTSGS